MCLDQNNVTSLLRSTQSTQGVTKPKEHVLVNGHQNIDRLSLPNSLRPSKLLQLHCLDKTVISANDRHADLLPPPPSCASNISIPDRTPSRQQDLFPLFQLGCPRRHPTAFPFTSSMSSSPSELPVQLVSESVSSGSSPFASAGIFMILCCFLTCLSRSAAPRSMRRILVRPHLQPRADTTSTYPQ